jgi:5-methylcytosine-specific restriction endonuclease McrA
MIFCITCDLPFDKKYNCQKYCSDKCRWASPKHAAKRKKDRRSLRDRRLFFIRALKIILGCELCGYRKHPSALQFDHINPEDKLMSVSKAHSWGLKETLEEMSKCRVLCANCHAIHSYNQWTVKKNDKEESRLSAGA